MSDPVIIPPTLQINCVAEVPTINCNTAYFFEPLSTDFTVPAVSGTAILTVCNSAQYSLGAYVWIQGAGFFEVISRPNSTTISIQNNGTPGNVAPTSVIGSGAAIVHTPPPEKSRWLEADDTWNPGSILAGNMEAVEITVAGAVLGDLVIASFSLDLQDLILSAAVTAADTVTAVLFNPMVWLTGSDTWDPGSIADGDEEAKEITVTGAALGDIAIASFSLDVADLVLDANVTAADTVTAVLANNTGGAVDLASGTILARVLQANPVNLAEGTLRVRVMPQS